jgi:hypothetical protein
MQPADPPTDTDPADLPSADVVWSRRSEALSVALWSSFLVACVETMFVFALVDPVALGLEGLSPSLIALRPAIYGAGFFFFWLFAFLAAALTSYMVETRRRRTQP